MKPAYLLFAAALLLAACRGKSPEDLPKFKKKFRAQIASFENQKVQADNKVEDGVSTLNGLQQALENAKNVDAEFKEVYGKWEQVNKQVEDLNREYEQLKQDASNLFSAMERQTGSLSDAKTRNELTAAIKTTRAEYDKTLAKTSKAIEQLRALHQDAVEVIKALEVAIALGQISQISSGLQSIESRVAGIMAELNSTIAVSKDLYEKRIGAF
jgi:chromosome segregation ATPase